MTVAAILILSALLYAGMGWALRWVALAPDAPATPAQRFETLAAARRVADNGLLLVALGLFALGAALGMAL